MRYTTSPNGIAVRGPQRSDYGNVSFVLETKENVVAGAVDGETTTDDAIYDTYTTATIYEDGQITLDTSLIITPVFQSLNPDIGAIDQDGYITRVSPGECVFLAEAQYRERFFLDMSDQSSSTSTWNRAVAGSMAEACIDGTVDRISDGMTIADDCTLYSTQDHTTPNYIRNPSLWCSDVDLTCISPWNSNGGVRKAGTLVTPRHILFAAHYEYPAGTTVRFVEADGTVHDRVMTGIKRHPDYANYYPDLTIGTLDSDLPAGISFVEIASEADVDARVKQWIDNGPGSFGLNQYEEAIPWDMKYFTIANSPTTGRYAGLSKGKIPKTAALVKNIIVGDSGNPSFWIINGSLVLITVWTNGGTGGGGTFVGSFISDLNQMIIDSDIIAGVSTGYTITVADLSSFPTY